MNAEPAVRVPRDDPSYQEQSFAFRAFGAGGLSAHALGTHVELYRGYLAETNALLGAVLVPDARRNAAATARPRESVARRTSFELNGVKLHESYFEQLAGRGGVSRPGAASVAAEAMDVCFDGHDAWREDILALATIRGVGWVVSAYDAAAGQLLNLWVDLHHLMLPAGLEIVFVLDLWEHAYWEDFGPTGRGAYARFVLDNTDWQVLEARFERQAFAASSPKQGAPRAVAADRSQL
jgi:Fe-Mn family superoxide dismutase